MRRCQGDHGRCLALPEWPHTEACAAEAALAGLDAVLDHATAEAALWPEWMRSDENRSARAALVAQKEKP